MVAGAGVAVSRVIVVARLARGPLTHVRGRACRRGHRSSSASWRPVSCDHAALPWRVRSGGSGPPSAGATSYAGHARRPASNHSHGRRPHRRRSGPRWRARHEVAHGDGLAGDQPQLRIGSNKDWEWIQAAAEKLGWAVLTTLPLSGIRTIQELEHAYSHGVRSVRVATHCTEADVARHIATATSLQLQRQPGARDSPPARSRTWNGNTASVQPEAYGLPHECSGGRSGREATPRTTAGPDIGLAPPRLRTVTGGGRPPEVRIGDPDMKCRPTRSTEAPHDRLVDCSRPTRRYCNGYCNAG
ncbi:MAG: 4-hydroxy-2-oxovalerate aldolase/4-hydroxy-2-ketovalerate aldolase [Modestobacter sp.]|nr:4-hydroxy-2-oxovalerate aldolase/4-hydroxy-2-ketovalerate aldolase [Modestobacter sp.]